MSLFIHSAYRCLRYGVISTRVLSTTSQCCVSNRERKRKYWKYKPKPKMKEEERLELDRETAEMRASVEQLAQDPAALYELIEEGMPEEYDVVHGIRRPKEEARRDELRRRQITKQKIIERKYFRKPPEVTLLTWAAKEQIKYLNEHYPDEWTPEQIAKSFPISREGVVKLLKSEYVPRTAEKIYEHDQRVVRNWKLLSVGGATGGPLAERKRSMLAEGSVRERLANFGVIPALPKPVMKSETETKMRTKPGLFESIVVNFASKTDAVKSLPDHSLNEKQILQIAAKFQTKNLSSTLPNESDPLTRNSDSKSDRNNRNLETIPYVKDNLRGDRSSERGVRIRRRTRSTSAGSMSSGKTLFQLQMEGTGKLESQRDDRRS